MEYDQQLEMGVAVMPSLICRPLLPLPMHTLAQILVRPGYDYIRYGKKQT